MTKQKQTRYTHHRKMLHEVTLEVVATAMGREPADLIIKNGRLVNVNVARIEDNMTVAGRHGDLLDPFPGKEQLRAGRYRRRLGHAVRDHLRTHRAAADKHALAGALHRGDGRIAWRREIGGY